MTRTSGYPLIDSPIVQAIRQSYYEGQAHLGITKSELSISQVAQVCFSLLMDGPLELRVTETSPFEEKRAWFFSFQVCDGGNTLNHCITINPDFDFQDELIKISQSKNRYLTCKDYDVTGKETVRRWTYHSTLHDRSVLSLAVNKSLVFRQGF